MNQTLPILLTLLAFALFVKFVFYPQERSKQLEKKLPEAYASEWEIFIRANINSCRTREQTDRCFELIELFDRWFSPSLPKDIMYSKLDKLFNRLKKKCAVIREEEENFKKGIVLKVI